MNPVVGMAAGLALAHGAGRLFAALRQPPVAGEMLVGVAVGAWLLAPGGVASGSPPGTRAALDASALDQCGDVAIGLFVLLVGMAIGDRGGRRAWAMATRIAIVSCGVAVLAGVLLAGTVAAGALRPGNLGTAAYAASLAVVLSVNGLPIVARLLGDNRAIDVGPATVVLLSGLMITAFTFAALRVADVLAGARPSLASVLLGAAALAAALAALAVATPTAPGGEPRAADLARVLLLAAVAGVGSVLLVGTVVLGPFAVGLLAARRLRPPAAWRQRALVLVGRFVLPVYFLMVGSRLGAFGLHAEHVPIVLAVVLGLTVHGWAAGYLAAGAAGLPHVERSRVAGLGLCRGIVALIVAAEADRLGLVTPALAVALVVVGLVTTWLAGTVLARNVATWRAGAPG